MVRYNKGTKGVDYMGGFFVILGFFVALIGLYVGSYYFNSKTEAPADAPEVDCSTCNSTSCSLRKVSGPKTKDTCELE